MPQSRSPSPAAAPPTISAPGPRASALQNGFQKALEATLTKCDYTNFAACFPTAAQYAPAALRDFHHDFVGKLGEVARAEFEGVLAERDAVKGLNELDALVKEARDRKGAEEERAKEKGGEVVVPAAPHTLPPQQLHMAHLLPFLSSQHGVVVDSISQLQKQNQGLAEDITAQRREIEALVLALESVVKDVEAAGDLMMRQEAEGYTDEIREVEMELGS